MDGYRPTAGMLARAGAKTPCGNAGPRGRESCAEPGPLNRQGGHSNSGDIESVHGARVPRNADVTARPVGRREYISLRD
jgi:hypothetical protein